MASSLSLVTAQITFLDPQLVLIHIPIEYYSFFLQSVLQLLFGEDHDEDAAKIPWTNRHEFLNISITSTEVSIICSRDLAERYVVPIEKTLRRLFSQSPSWRGAEIVQEDYTVIQVDGPGMDAGQRVLELTGPLAMAGISIFFITTYFSDYILVPSRTKRTVTTALEQRGFIFSKAADAFISQLSPSLQYSHSRHESSSSTSSGWSPADGRSASLSAPATPPAKDIDELQLRTFKKLKGFGIDPEANRSLRLVSCAGSRDSDSGVEEQLKNDLLQVLLATPHNPDLSLSSGYTHGGDIPNFSTSFLSITITANEPVSILLEERLLARLGDSLLGAKEPADILVPIVFDLRKLGFETTGIIGGVAGKLSQQTDDKQLGLGGDGDVSPTAATFDAVDTTPSTAPEINFLSTAKSGMVIVKACHLEKAMKDLEKGYNELGDHVRVGER